MDRRGASIRKLLPTALGLLFLFATASAVAQMRPLWELGVGLGGIDLPAYRGADERSRYLLPLPYVQYRGERFQINRNRMRGLLLRRDRMEMDVSLSGSVPVRGVQARAGMPDLDPTLELGPSLNLHLLYDEARHTNLDLRLPLRAVVATNGRDFDHQGWLFHPRLSLELRDVAKSRWNLALHADLLYGDQGYHRYFYEVAPQYATVDRPAYVAPAGYAGRQFSIALSRRLGDLVLGAFVKWDGLGGAAFEASPLVRRSQSVSAGFVLAWVFAKSERMVEVSDD